MRWRAVAIAGMLGPAAAGCNVAHQAARNIINEPHVVWTQHAIKEDLRKSAKSAWELARGECPEHADSEEFRDGFIDGYVDYLDRGGIASLPAVPPAKYTRHKKYFTENGQCLVKEYFLGFKFGQETAIASGRRQLLTVPVLLPMEPSGPPTFNLQPGGTEPPPMMVPPRPPGGNGIGPERMPQRPAAPASIRPGSLTPAGLPRVVAKTAPPDGYHPVSKPLLVVVSAVAKSDPPIGVPAIAPWSAAKLEPEPVHTPVVEPPLPLPVKPVPSGPAAWGSLPDIPAMPDVPVATPQLTAPPTPTTGRMQLPPNHPKPRE